MKIRLPKESDAAYEARSQEPEPKSKYTIKGHYKDNDVVLLGGVSGKEFIRFTDKGMIYKGGLIEDKGKVYKRFVQWLERAEFALDGAEKPEEVLDTKWIVVQSSVDGEEPWLNLMPEDVPEWVKDPEVMGGMMGGNRVSRDPKKGSMWYRAIHVDAPEVH
jgi:hypothetical protein